MVPDIWAIIQSGNLYMYVMHNPVRVIDLDGLAARCIKRTLDTGGSGGGGKSPGGGTRIPSGAGVPTPPTRIVTPQPIPKTQPPATKAPQAPAAQTSNKNINTTSSSIRNTVGEPNSVTRRIDSNGNVVQERHFGSDGRATHDIDFGHPHHHNLQPDQAHKHTWDWTTPDNPIRTFRGLVQ